MLLNKNKALKLIELLNKSIKNPKTSLKYRNQFTLLTSVVLSAQCTDVNVNNVTKSIYKKYYTPKHFADLGINKIRNLIRSIGLFNNKAKNLYYLSKILLEKYQSKIPNKFEAGLQDYAGIIGLGEACNYLMKIGMKNIKHKDGWELGTGQNYSINEVYLMFKERFGVDFTSLPNQSGNYRKTLRENDDSLKELNWSPSDKLRDYILSLNKH